jgi:hypothetical protein
MLLLCLTIKAVKPDTRVTRQTAVHNTHNKMLQYKVKFTTMNNACRLIVGWTTNYHHCFFSWRFIGALKQLWQYRLIVSHNKLL